MEKAQVFDFCIIGGGYGALKTALHALENKLSVCIIEPRLYIGGTSLHEGFTSKCLLNSSHKFFEAKHVMKKHGVFCKDVTHDFSAMMRKKTDLFALVGANNNRKLREAGCVIYRGWGKILNPYEVEVTEMPNQYGGTGNNSGNGHGNANGSQAKDATDPSVATVKKFIIKCKNIVLNTGGEPITLPSAVPMDGKRVVNSTQCLSLHTLPKSMIVVGGGFIGLEIGSVYAKLGCDVTVVEFYDRILAEFDGDISRKMEEIFREMGMKFLFNSKVTHWETKAEGVDVLIEDSHGGEQRLSIEVLFLAVGRRPRTKGCGLESVGVELDARGRVVINEKMQTNVPNIYAVGDITNKGPAVAHKAGGQAFALVDTYLGRKTHLNYDLIPNVVYTQPEIASVGKTEEQLKKEGVDYKVGFCHFSDNTRAKSVEDTDGFVKFLVENNTNKILGIHMIGPQAGEQIMEGVMGIEYAAKSEFVARISHAHPLFAEAFRDAANNATRPKL